MQIKTIVLEEKKKEQGQNRIFATFLGFILQFLTINWIY